MRTACVGGIALSLMVSCSASDGFERPHRSDGAGPIDAPEPATMVRVVPTDERPVVTAETPPVPISGGTLLVTRDGLTVVAADPDRDRVSIVDLRARRLLRTIEIGAGDEPGRIVEDASGRVHVALRGAGAVLTLDARLGEVLARRSVCQAPRGLAFDAAADALHVACNDGVLVTLPTEGDAIVRTLQLGPGLRDVLVRGDHLLVSRFRSAEILDIGPDGTVVSTTGIPAAVQHVPRAPQNEFEAPSVEPRTIEADAAWRMVQGADGAAVVIHQFASVASIDISEPVEEGPIVQEPGEGDPSPYGSAGTVDFPTCDGIVNAAISQVRANGTVSTGGLLPDATLSVDVAVSPDGRWAAVAHAGALDPAAPVPTIEVEGAGGASFAPVGRRPRGVTIAELGPTLSGFTAGCDAPLLDVIDVAERGQAVAVAFNPNMDDESVAAGPWLVIQSREPAELYFVDIAPDISSVVPLGGKSVLDTGHELFHRDAGAGIACASCHLEGGDDGRVWHFDPIGPRRTQSLNVGLRGTEPFHWDGDMDNLTMLMSEVFVQRMGGARQNQSRVQGMANWIFSLEAPAPIVAAGDEGAVRGRALFESVEVGCSTCHTGPSLTNSQSYDVGTADPGHLLQVPSLVGIGYRAPYIHTGCAPTLEDRFDPSCGGGDAHGRTSQLTTEELADLTTYLKTL